METNKKNHKKELLHEMSTKTLSRQTIGKERTVVKTSNVSSPNGYGKIIGFTRAHKLCPTGGSIQLAFQKTDYSLLLLRFLAVLIEHLVGLCF